MSRVYVFGRREDIFDRTLQVLGIERRAAIMVRSERDLLGHRFHVGDRLVGLPYIYRYVAYLLVIGKFRLDDYGYVIADD